MTDSALAREVVDGDEASVTADFIAFLQAASERRHRAGEMRRFNQGRAAGCVDAEFSVLPNLPDDCRVGLFAEPRSYQARIRFAHAVSASDRDKDTRGMSIALTGVVGENLTPGATRQDFILNSHPVMMVPGPKEFLELLQAVEAGGIRRVLYFIGHPGAARIAMASRQNPTSHLDIPYWSTTPYLFGPGRAVKYIVRPSAGPASVLPSRLTDTYLRDALADRLRSGDASFDFLIQLQTDARKMPIEDASIEWREEDSPPRAVARIRIGRQQVPDPSSDNACEALSFNPWHALPDHRPLGSYNRARREIYRAMAAFRHDRNSR